MGMEKWREGGSKFKVEDHQGREGEMEEGTGSLTEIK
jgi:hypothetical protein